VKLVSLAGAKDASELYLQDREGFAARFEDELQRAVPYEDSAGVVGERRLCKLVYLTVTARFLDRFPSIAVKGPSSSGKSWTIERVLNFFPAEAYYLLTAMSERALAYGTEPLSHRFLVLFEAAGLESDFASYLVRSLLSEGCVRYETVEKDKGGQLCTRLVERAGPTGLIVSTTSVALHPENETRLLSLSATDTSDQTKLVLSCLAVDEGPGPDFSRWHELQVWLATAEHRVATPYAQALAELVPPVAVRLRRDFRAVLSLVRAHAILHQASRERDTDGKVIATLEDYAIVRELVVDLISEGVEATVPPTVRETVQAVSAHTSEEGVSITALAQALNLDKTSASRRWKNARERGYLKNLETGRGKPARLVLADPLPDDIEVLPSVDALRHKVDNTAWRPTRAFASPRSDVGQGEAELSAESQEPDTDPRDGDDRTREPPRGAEDRVEPTLDEALGIETLRGAFLDKFGTLSSAASASTAPIGTPRGKLVGTCLCCNDGVYETDMTFGAWDGTRWRFSGYTLPGAARLAALHPLLCREHAIRVKYGLLAPPTPSIAGGCRR
jgi:hypothetical protein